VHGVRCLLVRVRAGSDYLLLADRRKRIPYRLGIVPA
jgi:hypothetical protein